MASTIMGSTETTLYTIAIYVGAVKIKNIRTYLFKLYKFKILGVSPKNPQFFNFISQSYKIYILLIFLY